jgi:two-component system NtrC family sensor kinase
MHDLNKFGLREMTLCQSFLRQSGSDAESMEEVANNVVQYLNDNLIDGTTGAKACSLIRFFKTHDYETLEDDLKVFAKNILKNSGVNEAPDMKCLTLLATAGDKPDWNSRQKSNGHRAIPLPSQDFVERLPMIANLIKQFNLEISKVLKPDPGFILDTSEADYGVFYIPNAVDNEMIPDQEGFVKPLGIKSVLGFGGVLPSGNFFAVILFSKVKISQQTANLFKTLALAVEFSVTLFGERVFSQEI